MGTSKILIDGVGIDLTQDTVAANKMLSGIKAHDSNGDSVTGSIQTYTGTEESKATVMDIEGTGYKDMGSWDLIANSVDEDDNPYNGGLGYKDGYRLNSSGAEVVSSTGFVTGFIPVGTFKQIYAFMDALTGSESVYSISRFGSSKNYINYANGAGCILSINYASSNTTSFVRISFIKASASTSPLDCGARVKIVQ